MFAVGALRKLAEFLRFVVPVDDDAPRPGSEDYESQEWGMWLVRVPAGLFKLLTRSNCANKLFVEPKLRALLCPLRLFYCRSDPVPRSASQGYRFLLLVATPVLWLPFLLLDE
jgi:hypothetical protein